MGNMARVYAISKTSEDRMREIVRKISSSSRSIQKIPKKIIEADFSKYEERVVALHLVGKLPEFKGTRTGRFLCHT